MSSTLITGTKGIMCKCPCCSDRKRLVNAAWEMGWDSRDFSIESLTTDKEELKKLDTRQILRGSCDED